MISDLYLKLKEQNINIEVLNNNLDIKAPKGVLTKELINEIKENKEDLINFISQYKDESEDFIKNIDVKSQYVLSSSQLRLWALSHSQEGNVAYNSIGGYVFEGELNFEFLNQSLNEVVARHESLRTVFKEDTNGEVYQIIKEPKDIDFNIEYCDLREESNIDQELKHNISQDSIIPFELSKGPLFKTKLYHIGEGKWVFVYVIHHIIIDAPSMKIFISEILESYNSKKEGRENRLVPLRIQYKDYASWENEQLSGKKYDNLKDYWLNLFKGELPILNMPKDKKRPVVQTFNGDSFDKTFDIDLSKNIETIIKNNNATMFMGLTSVMTALFYKYSSQEDIIIGTPISGREDSDLHNQIGYYGNTLALRMQFAKENSFIDLLKYTKKHVLEVYKHQMFPFATLVKELNIKRDTSRNPLFDVQVIYGEGENQSKKEELRGLSVSSYEFEEKLKTSRFDIVFSFYKEGKNLKLNIQYNTDIYSERVINQIAEHISVIMTHITENPDNEIGNLSYMSQLERDRIIEGSRGKELIYNKEKTVLDLFYEQVAKKPNSTAIAFGNDSMTYKELDEKSSQLSNYLIGAYQLKENNLVGLMINNSKNTLVCILGILKAGAAYVPIDPSYPKERVKYIIEDTDLNVLLTESDYLFDLDYYSGNIFAADIQLDAIEGESIVPLTHIDTTNLAYVIYTSGSTGKAKGVLIDHKNLMHSTVARLDTYPNVETFLLLSSISFDSSIAGIFGTISSGGKLVISPKIGVSDIDSIIQIILNEKVTHLLTVPSYYQLLLKGLDEIKTDLKAVIVAGEECSKSLVKSHQESINLKKCDLYNEYGPTEATVWASYYLYDASQEFIPSIGKPIPNTTVYVLNENKELVTPGVIGELYIGGEGVSRGYLNNLLLTQEKFVDNPFEPGKRIYKTGDIGRKEANNNIEFLGRKDSQIKIRGYRLELGEVESVICNYESINKVVVTYEDDILRAYLQVDEEIDIDKLKAYLKGELPSHAIPSAYNILESFPLLPNGKIDKNKLLLLGNMIDDNREYIAPSNDIEKVLVEVFKEVLRKEKVGVNDEFFALGGDSIKAIQIISKLKQKNYSLAVQDVMQYPMIRDLVMHVKEVKERIDQSLVEGVIPLSPIQQHFFETVKTSQHHYNQSMMLKTEKELSEEGLNAVFKKIVTHHDALRMVYKQKGSEWIQEINNDDINFKLIIEDFSNETEFRKKCQYLQSSFKLEEGPLFKAILFKNESVNYLLMISHHLVIDGVSWRIILEDLSTLYFQFCNSEKLELPLKTHSFKSWQEKQIEYANSTVMANEEEYWQNVEQLVNSRKIELPKDFDYRGENFYCDFKTQMFQLNSSLTKTLLTESHKAYKTTINDVLIAALSIAINKVFGLKDSVIQLEGHGREDINSELDITRTIGWFTSIFPIHIKQKTNEENNIEQLIEVKETLHRIPNKGIGYGILKHLKGSNLRIQPDVSFNYLGNFDIGNKENDNELFQFSNDYKGEEISPKIERTGTIDITGILVSEQLQLMISYNSNFYKESTIGQFKNVYKIELQELIENLSKEEDIHLTPVDLTYKGLSLKNLEELNRII